MNKFSPLRYGRSLSQGGRPSYSVQDFDYSFLALNAESGNNVIQFARRSSGSGKRVSGTVDGHGRHTIVFWSAKTERRDRMAVSTQASPADSSISHKRKNGTYNNGPRHSGKVILCCVAVFAGFWLGVAAVSAYVHFSGR